MITEMDKPMVSVCMITYNHEAFIAKAIEGVLMQEVDFEVELIISDDASGDGTCNIVHEISKTHKNGKWIKFYQQQQNLGIIPNFIWTLKKCKGDFIAVCEGDDYWIESYKLAKQVSFLMENIDFSASGHNSIVINELYDSKKRKLFTKEESDKILCFNDFLGHRPFHTASLVLRASCLNQLDVIKQVYSGDRSIYLLLSSQGPIKYFDTPMCVYRKHPDGISSNVDSKLLVKDINILKALGNATTKEKTQFLKYFHGSIFYNSTTISNYSIVLHALYHCFYILLSREFPIKYFFNFFFKKLPKKIVFNTFNN